MVTAPAAQPFSSGGTDSRGCGNGTNQENMWTTSREITVADGVTTVILVEGADSESFCQCKARPNHVPEHPSQEAVQVSTPET